jgi:hypothetical protein
MSTAFVFPDPDLDPVGSEILLGSGYGSVKNHSRSKQLQIRKEFVVKLKLIELKKNAHFKISISLKKFP